VRSVFLIIISVIALKKGISKFKNRQIVNEEKMEIGELKALQPNEAIKIKTESFDV